jgi:uncharacterized membrane protein required for colicin V production
VSLDILNQFNWIDILVVIILFRIGYVALRSGFSAEIFKLLGIIAAIYLSLHYYTVWADSFQRVAVLKFIPVEILIPISFLLLVIVGYMFFVFLRGIFYRFLKLEASPNLNKWGGFLLGVARGILTVSLIICFFTISGIGYLNKSVNSAYSGKPLFEIAPTVYTQLWENITSKFIPQEKFNNSIYTTKAKPES